MLGFSLKKHSNIQITKIMRLVRDTFLKPLSGKRHCIAADVCRHEFVALGFEGSGVLMGLRGNGNLIIDRVMRASHLEI